MKSTLKRNRGLLLELLIIVILAVSMSIILRQLLIESTGLETPLVVVRGHSMYPFFLDGDMVVIFRENVSNVELGDIVVYRTITGRMIIHRVIEKRKINNHITLIVKGDNNPMPDIPPVSQPRLVGKVASIKAKLDANKTAVLVPKIPLIGRLLPITGG